MRKLLLLAIVPLLMGNADNTVYFKTIDFIKKNEGLEFVAYKDGETYSVCYGNKYLPNGDRVKKGDLFSLGQCEEIVHYHFNERVAKYVTAQGNKRIVLCDTAYQYGYTVLKKKNLKRYIKSYPQRGRWKLYNDKA